jgi:hypothetical protein
MAQITALFANLVEDCRYLEKEESVCHGLIPRYSTCLYPALTIKLNKNTVVSFYLMDTFGIIDHVACCAVFGIDLHAMEST